nr:PREDICTED: TPPP family protein CG45057-like [Megachile rotundata]
MEDFVVKQKEPEVSFEEIFKTYCEMDPVSSSRNLELIPLSQSDRWLISARILDMITITTTDTGLAYFKFRKRALSYEEYLIYLNDLAETHNLNLETMKLKMKMCGKPKQTASAIL